MASPVPPAATIEEMRERLVGWMQIVATLAAGVLCAVLMAALPVLAPATGPRVVGFLASLVPFAEALGKLLGAGVAEGIAPPLIAFVVGAGAFWQARGLVRWAADRLFPPFDTDLLHPIRRAGALDPLWAPPLGNDQGMRPLPWIAPPPDSPRRPVWAALIAFLSDDAGDGRFNLFNHPTSSFLRFRWIVLTGRPGSGKTRMATEIARARARREVLGDDPPATSGTHRPTRDEQARQRKSERRRLERGSWLRFAWPFAPRREIPAPGVRDDAPWHGADPWDAAWLVAASEAGDIRQRNRFDDGLLARLRDWRPRRPTVLVLDDPGAGSAHVDGDAGRVIAALLAGEARYHHPVRLIVVTQTLPEELGFERRIDGSWGTQPRGFAGSVLTLDGTTPLSAAEVRRMFGALRLSGHMSGWTPSDANVRRLLLQSRRNALLVCLALQRIQRRPNADLASAEDVLLDRAQRIVDALKAAGLGAPERLHAIAWATLAGGADGAIGPVAREPLGDWPRFEVSALDAVPNLDPAWPPPLPPRVHPEPIGDAFVRLALSDRHCGADTRRRLIVAAWRANPLGTLLAAQRLSAGTDAVAATLRLGPPGDADLDPAEVAMAYVTAAIRVPREEWDAGELPRIGRATLTALHRIRRLAPEHAATVFARLVDLLETPNAVAVIRGRAALLCVCAVIRRVLAGETPWPTPDAADEALARLTRVLEELRWWGVDPRRNRRSPVSRVLGEFAERAACGLRGDAADDRLEQLAEAAWRTRWSVPGSARSVLLDLGVWHAEQSEHRGPIFIARGYRLVAAGTGISSDAGETCVRAASGVDRIAEPFLHDRGFQLERVKAWCQVAEARDDDAAACESAARHVDDLARPFAGDRDFELERVRAWSVVAYARSDNVAACESTARQVDDLARPFAGDRAFELERVRAWAYVAYVRPDEPVGLESAAQHVDGLAGPFAGDRDFEFERVRAWRQVAYARRNDVAGCESAARHVDDLARPFAGGRGFEVERVKAWSWVAYARRDAAAGCENAARHVDDLARPFAGDRDFEVERVRAWRYVAYARQDAAGCESAARHVDDLARPFAGERDFELERVRAWRFVAYARQDAAGCESAARHVDDLARPFGGKREFELERVEAWRFVAYARRNDTAGCESAARQVDDLARPFAGVREFELERVRAWLAPAYAHRSDAAGFESAARHVRDLARPFAGDPEFERELSDMRRFSRSLPPGTAGFSGWPR